MGNVGRGLDVDGRIVFVCGGVLGSCARLAGRPDVVMLLYRARVLLAGMFVECGRMEGRVMDIAALARELQWLVHRALTPAWRGTLPVQELDNSAASGRHTTYGIWNMC